MDQVTAAEKWYQEQKLAYQAEQTESVQPEIVANRLSTGEKVVRKRQVKSVIRRLQLL